MFNCSKNKTLEGTWENNDLILTMTNNYIEFLEKYDTSTSILYSYKIKNDTIYLFKEFCPQDKFSLIYTMKNDSIIFSTKQENFYSFMISNYLDKPFHKITNKSNLSSTSKFYTSLSFDKHQNESILGEYIDSVDNVKYTFKKDSNSQYLLIKEFQNEVNSYLFLLKNGSLINFFPCNNRSRVYEFRKENDNIVIEDIFHNVHLLSPLPSSVSNL